MIQYTLLKIKCVVATVHHHVEECWYWNPIEIASEENFLFEDIWSTIVFAKKSKFKDRLDKSAAVAFSLGVCSAMLLAILRPLTTKDQTGRVLNITCIACEATLTLVMYLAAPKLTNARPPPIALNHKARA